MELAASSASRCLDRADVRSAPFPVWEPGGNGVASPTWVKPNRAIAVEAPYLVFSEVFHLFSLPLGPFGWPEQSPTYFFRRRIYALHSFDVLVVRPAGPLAFVFDHTRCSC